MTYGNYVLATIHRDNETVGYCTNQFSSTEDDEDAWIERINDNLTATPYNWSVDDNAFNWQNGYFVFGVPSVVDLSGGLNEYESDGWGPVVTVTGN